MRIESKLRTVTVGPDLGVTSHYITSGGTTEEPIYATLPNAHTLPPHLFRLAPLSGQEELTNPSKMVTPHTHTTELSRKYGRS